MASASASIASGVIGYGLPRAVAADEPAARGREAERAAARPAGRAVVQHRQIAGFVQQLEQCPQHQRRLDGASRDAEVELAQRVAQQREHALLGLVLGGQAGGGLADDRRRGESLAVGAQPGEDVHQLRLRHRVERPARVQHQVADVEGLQAAAPARRRLAHALDDGVHAPELAREQPDDAVGLAQRPRAQDDGASLLGARHQAPSPAPRRRAKTTRGTPERSLRRSGAS